MYRSQLSIQPLLCLSVSILIHLFVPTLHARQPQPNLRTETGQPFRAKLSGRLFLDGISFLSERDTLSDRLNLVDLRLAGKVTFGAWYAKLDIGFAHNKLSIKDAFLQYRYRDHYFRAGYMLGYFGLDQNFSTCDYLFNTESAIAGAIYPGRRNGISYNYSVPHFYLAAGAFLGDKLTVHENEQPGYNATLRGIWRPINEPERLLHIGISSYCRVPDKDRRTGHQRITLSNRGVTYLKVPAFQSITLNAKDQYSLSAEFYGFRHKWMAQAEYLMTSIGTRTPDGIQRYIAHGGYLVVGYLLKGEHYGYDPLDAVPTMPTDPHSLLLVARVGASDLNDHGIQLSGGFQKDLTLGLDYFLDNYISTRLSYSYVHLDEHSPLSERDIHLFQARLQFRF